VERGDLLCRVVFDQGTEVTQYVIAELTVSGDNSPSTMYGVEVHKNGTP
jgi:hypothetical protein